jgi:hypothetical protein
MVPGDDCQSHSYGFHGLTGKFTNFYILSRHFHRSSLERHLHCRAWCNEAAERDMKIYLLIMLIGALLTAVHFTSGPEKRPETLPQ